MPIDQDRPGLAAAHLAQLGRRHDTERPAELRGGDAPRAAIGPRSTILEPARSEFPTIARGDELGRFVLSFFGVVTRLRVIHSVDELNHPSPAAHQQHRPERQPDLQLAWFIRTNRQAFGPRRQADFSRVDPQRSNVDEAALQIDPYEP